MNRIIVTIAGLLSLSAFCGVLFQLGSGRDVGRWLPADSKGGLRLAISEPSQPGHLAMPLEDTSAPGPETFQRENDPAARDRTLLPSAGRSRAADGARTSQHGAPALVSASSSPRTARSAPGRSVASSDSGRAQGRAPSGVVQARVPLVFQDVDLFVQTTGGLRYAPVDFSRRTGSGATPRASNKPVPGAPGTVIVDESTAVALDELRQSFTSAVGGMNQNPEDPGYLQRWRSAQILSDQHFRAQYGDTAFNRYQIAAAQKAEAERQAVTNP